MSEFTKFLASINEEQIRNVVNGMSDDGLLGAMYWDRMQEYYALSDADVMLCELPTEIHNRFYPAHQGCTEQEISALTEGVHLGIFAVMRLAAEADQHLRQHDQGSGGHHQWGARRLTLHRLIR